ncbi:MAG: ATP-binding cassette domain-containing protein [Methanosarcina mazei]|uniref:Molybdate/tungstate import ATP-binding protein WtpC n=3 Tax=Methanosarcina mazei TaxID=2209 RepID=A0A0E3RMD6_METMZ|nr:ATP-binding cassette domain-containing protein [Methanosarcina mazei]AAM31274.1 Molybdate ABC transporter, ATP-binding protein [Methanosarcina mazei Go1]AKB62941.1 Tungstate ABC transporter, ATP-binding protein WtpC [Methanosarcina mazei SarPi]AKB66287.1 Tungstate ABC transporter, ATP-binding protein WtpC [Methanosarcina mazei S-6]WIM44785.1 ATP-binding cassette domain-containing protein [Methanosarcina mazei]WIM48244.1 ATP-binding cassette domain-containing protein [Methanosarcina mazei]
MSFLEVRDLCLDVGDFELSGIGLKAEKGDYLALIGPTGSGKSLLLETIIGFYGPEKGRIILEGKDITNFPPDMRQISIVYQDHVLFPHMDIFENIAYALRKKLRDKKQIEAEVKQIAGVLGIGELLHRKPATLSGGEKQRAAIARSLVVRPKLLLLDEPFSALDARTKEKLREMLKKAISEYSTTVLHVTHDFEDVWALANRVVVIRKGEVMQAGDPESVFKRPSPDFVAEFLGTNVLKGCVKALEGKLTVVEAEGMKIYSSDPAEPGEGVTVSIRPEEIILAREALESSARNTVQGRVSGVFKKEHLVVVEVEIGNAEIKAVITPTSCEMLGLEPGREIYAVFKASNARIIR